MLLNSARIDRFGGSDRNLLTINFKGFFQMNRINPMQ